MNERFQTAVPGVYAIGDVVGEFNVGSQGRGRGCCFAEFIANKHDINYFAIPNVIYTWPEVATVGMTEQECKEKGLDVKVGKVPFAANGRANVWAKQMAL